jgi:TonB family protein
VKWNTDIALLAHYHKGASMKNLSATLIAILFAVSFIHGSFAQDPKDSPQKTATSAAASAGDEPKGEVNVALEDLKKRGDSVLMFEGKQSDNSPDKNGVINGRAIKLVTPAYPDIARSAHASGEVIVRVLIDKEGKVMAAQVVDGHPLLQAASIKAAKATRFTPTWVEGNQVNVLGQIVYNFTVAK